MVGLDGALTTWPGAGGDVSGDGQGEVCREVGLLAGLTAAHRRIAAWVPGVAELARLYPAFTRCGARIAADRALATLDIRWSADGHHL